jgi:hypothetical protein
MKASLSSRKPLEELRANVRDAVHTHFETKQFVSGSVSKRPGSSIGRAAIEDPSTLKNWKAMKQIFIGLSIIAALAVLVLSVGCATTPQEIKQQSYNPPVFPG